jgi:hypothetical protein
MKNEQYRVLAHQGYGGDIDKGEKLQGRNCRLDMNIAE